MSINTVHILYEQANGLEKILRDQINVTKKTIRINLCTYKFTHLQT